MIALGGQLSQSLTQGLLRLFISENVEGLSRCEATIGNWGPSGTAPGFLYFDRRVLDFGKQFVVKTGTDTLMDGRIMGLEAGFPDGNSPEITVLVEDRFQDLRMTRRTRTFNDVKDADVFSQIASEHGLSPSIDVQGPTHKVLAQVNQSDLAFLRERARMIGAEVWMEGRTLNAKSRANRHGDTVQLSWGSELREFRVLADLAGQRTGVWVNGWDVASKSAVHCNADDSAIGGELNGGTSGASILSSKLGERKEALAHTVPFTSGEAQAQAEAYFRMSARRFLTGHGVAHANSRIVVGSLLELSGLGPLFSGKYYVTEVHHLFDLEMGMRTDFLVERPGLGQPQ